jgi:hypothetical protein
LIHPFLSTQIPILSTQISISTNFFQITFIYPSLPESAFYQFWILSVGFYSTSIRGRLQEGIGGRLIGCGCAFDHSFPQYSDSHLSTQIFISTNFFQITFINPSLPESAFYPFHILSKGFYSFPFSVLRSFFSSVLRSSFEYSNIHFHKLFSNHFHRPFTSRIRILPILHPTNFNIQ